MAEGHRKIEGVLLGAPDGLRLVSPATGESWHAVAAVGQAVQALDLLHPDGMDGFLAEIRARPRMTVWGEFLLRDEDGAFGLVQADVKRRVTAEELAEATGIDIKVSLASLREQGIEPIMSAEALHELMRGGDHDGEEEPQGPRP